MRTKQPLSVEELEIKSLEYRKTVLSIIAKAGAGHTGGSLSSIDILNVLYNAVMNVSPEQVNDPLRDRYIHSKGHSVESLYAVLAGCGFFPQEQLETLNQGGSHFVGHPTRKIPGIEQNTGGLGHGLSVGVGMALAAKRDGLPYRVFVTMGDGELCEGSVWEASMSAANYELDNLVAIIDRNKLQITGRTEDVMRLEPLAERFAAFGFAVRECAGNDIGALLDAFSTVPWQPGKPNLLLAHTTKGKGVSFIENAVGWHHHVPTATELEKGLGELDAQLATLQGSAVAAESEANYV
jgi:transketolase